jgi:ribosomal protein L37AE/L43A/predicted  nucleic acid-binding Zn-ribbon protein
MGADEKNRNEILSRLVADLSVKSTGDQELSSKIHSLRDEIKKIVEDNETIFGKLRGLVESFREIIPEESQRYTAAVKALSATSKLSRQEIVKDVNNQLAELKILEKGLLSALPGWRDEIKAMEFRSREMRDEIAKLRERITQIESEEKGILAGMATRQKEMEFVEKSVGELFAEIGAEIASVKKKVEDFTAESAASQPIPPRAPVKSDIPIGKKEVEEKKSEILGSSAPQGTEWQKKCPMCGGRMDFHLQEKMWMCYTCAYEEPAKDEVQGKGNEKSGILESPMPEQDTEWQKKCPMCGGRMNFHGNENVWLCYTCAYEESNKGEARGTSEERPEQRNAPEIWPAAEPVSESQEPIKGSLPSKSQPTKKKTCPSCRKKMNWYEAERAWRCPYCEYERRI